MASHPEGARAGLLASLTGDPGRTLVRACERGFTAGDLLGAAAALRPRFLDGQGPLGIAFAQPGWLMAALLAAWSARRRPVLLDPGLKREAEVLQRLSPGVPIYADQKPAADGRLLVADLLAASLPVGDPPAWLSLPVDGEPFAALLTSASMGENKVVEKQGFQLYRQIEALASVLTLPARARVLSFVPPFHLLGFFYGLILPLAQGSETIVAVELAGTAMLELLEKYQPDLVVGTATHYRFLVRAAPGERSLRPSTIYLSSGAPLDPAVAGAFAAQYGTAVRDFYGSTELGGVALRSWPAPYRPMPGVRWQVDAETGGLQVMSPWGGGAQEAWVSTDDAAEEEVDGFRLLGRLDHVVKVGGKRFSTLEVEQALRAMPRVAEAAVFPYARFGEPAIAAAVVLERSAAVDETVVRAFLAGRLADYKLPRTILFLPALPRGSHDKVDYQTLRGMVGTG
jgi:acyl-coenzyme A synthetase/AMP-(fatty) acid ligase